MRLSLFALKQCIIKQLLDSVFVISGIIKVSVSVISLRLGLITLTSTLIIPHITKASSNNCLISIPLAWLFTGKEHALGALGRNYRCDILWKVTNSSYYILINLGIYCRIVTIWFSCKVVFIS